MNKMKKTSILIIAFIAMFIINSEVKADVTIGGDNSGGSGSGATTSGNWQYVSPYKAYGFRITVINSTTMKRVKDTKSVNVVAMSNKDGAPIYMTKNSHNKVSYIANSIGISLKQPKEKKYVTKVDKKIPDIFKKGGTKLHTFLEDANYSKLRTYVNQTGYKCLKKPTDDDCTNLENHYIIAEPLTVVKISGKYYWLTGAELAALTKTDQLRSTYEALNNAMYGSGSDLGYSTGTTCSGTDACREALTMKKMSGAGRYKMKWYTKIEIKKEWDSNPAATTCVKNSEATFRIRYQTKKDGKWSTTWSTYKGNLTIKGNNKISVNIPSTANRRYKVEERKTTIGCSGYKLTNTSNELSNSKKNNSKESTIFKYNEGKKITVTFKNTIVNNDIPTNTKKNITVEVYQMQGGFKTLEDSDTPTPGFSFKRQYGGVALAKDKNGYNIKYNDSTYQKQLFIGFNYNNSEEYAKYDVIDYATQMWSDPTDEWKPVGKKYIVEHTNSSYRSCKTYGNYLYKNDSMSCYNLYYNPVNDSGSDGQTRMWGGNDATAPMITKGYFNKKDAQQGVEVSLQESSNGYKTIEKATTSSTGTVTFSVESGKSYRVKISCDNCGGKNTYSKLVGRSTTTFVQGATSKSFTVSSDEDKDTNVKYIFLNNDKSSCQLDLEKIYNSNDSENSIKQQLVDLYYDYKEEGEYTNLLNFKPSDNLSTIKSKISTNNISCSKYSSNNISSIEKSCDQSDIKSNIDTSNYVLADYIDNSNVSQNIATNLFPSATGNHWNCFVSNYRIAYNDIKSIKNGVKLYNSSFLWQTINSNLVGNLEALVFCAGNTDNNVDEIENKEYVSSMFNSIKLFDEDNENIQNITIGNVVDDENYGQSYNVRQQNIDGCNSDNCSDGSDIMTEQNETSDEYTSDENKLLDDANLCGEVNDLNAARSNYYHDNACYNKNDEPFCPNGYVFDEDENVCYTNEQIKNDNTSEEKSKFQSKVYYLKYGLMYQKRYYADISSGTVSEKPGGKLIGWGVPVPINSTGGEIKFVYNFDTTNEIYKFFKETNSNLGTDFESKCSYTKQNVNTSNEVGRSRFVVTSNPFPGRTGNGRAYGSNWNSCYVSLSQRLGKESNISCYDLYGKNNSTKCPNGDTYCMYGDTNCDGKYDATDVFIYNQIYKSISNTTTISISQNVYHKQLLDLDQNGKINGIDVRLYFTWYNYTYGSGQSTDIQGNKHNINFKDKTTYVEYDATKTDSFSSCDSYIDQIIKNEDKSSNSTKEPMYSFTLSSKDLQNIRSYVKNTSTNTSTTYMNNDNLECDSSGFCKSKFITDLLSSFVVDNGLSLSGIDGQCKNRVQLNFRNGKITTNYCDY